MKKILYFSFTIILALQVASCINTGEDNPIITIVHTNDTHSQIDPSLSGGQPHGGVVERAATINQMRQEDPSLLYLDAGDMVQGSPYFNIYNGEVEILAMNQQGLVASTLGNHEFDNGLDGLAKMLSLADFPIVSCNYDCTGTIIEKYIKRQMIIKRNGVKIGITGVTVDPNSLIFNRNWEGIKYIDPTEAANKTAAELKAKGCDLIILLSHVGFFNSEEEGDLCIAKNSKNIDLIIGGHTHTNIENGVMVENAEGKPVWITQTGGKADLIGRISVKMTRATDKSTKYNVQDIIIDKLSPELYDAEEQGKAMSDFIAPYRDRLESQMSTIIGYAPATMTRTRPQSLLGNFTADALLQMGGEFYNHPMDMAIMNIGGMRSDLDKGDVTLGTMYRIYPFENTLSVLEIKGSHLEKAIKSMAGKKLEATAGAQITLETKNDRTQATDIKVGGNPIDPERTYYVATIDYLAEGNDGLTALTYADKYTNSGMMLRDVMTTWIKELTKKGLQVESELDNRVIEK